MWLAIATDIRNSIAEGQYVQGGKLPTETALAQRYGVNRHTVRHAFSKLIEEGLLRSRRGSGTFVANRPTDYPIGERVRFHENLMAAGRHPQKRVLQIEMRGAASGEAVALQISPGAQVCAYHGLSFADAAPVALFESIFPCDRLAGIGKALETHSSVTKALREVGVSDYTRQTTRLTAVSANATQAQHLLLREGDPLLRSTGVNVDRDLTPVEFGRTFFAGQRVTLTLDT